MGKGKAVSNVAPSRKNDDRIAKSLIKKKISKDKTYETSDEISFTKSLLEAGFFIRHMDSDGNCMFRSIADQLVGDAQKHDHYRQTIISYIESHEEHFAFFIEDSENFAEYIQRMRQDGEWGDQPELCAAAQSLNVNIFVHQVDSPTYVIRSESQNAHNIHLSYHGGCHYNSVRALDDDRYDTPACHQASSSTSVSCSESTSRNIDETAAKVSLAVPWACSKDVQTALRITQGEVDAAIEVLMSNPKGLSDIQEDEERGDIIVAEGDGAVDKKVETGKTNGKTNDDLKILSIKNDPDIKANESSTDIKSKTRKKSLVVTVIKKSMSKKVSVYK